MRVDHSRCAWLGETSFSFDGCVVRALVAFGLANVSPAKPAAGHPRLSSESAAAVAAVYWARGVRAVLPENAAAGKKQDVSISSVSCASAGNCSALGTYLDGSGDAQGLLLTETAGKWGAGIEAALPANAAGGKFGVSMRSASCASAGDCSAIGAYQADGTRTIPLARADAASDHQRRVESMTLAWASVPE